MVEDDKVIIHHVVPTGPVRLQTRHLPRPRAFEEICQVEQALVERCVKLLDQAQTISNLTNYHWWPQAV